MKPMPPRPPYHDNGSGEEALGLGGALAVVAACVVIVILLCVFVC